LYDLELETVYSEINKRRAVRVLLQLPDGMRPFALKIVEDIEKNTRAKVFLSGDSCYGACDVAISQAKELDADLIVHYGHSSMIESLEVPVIYVHAKIDLEIDQLTEAILPHLKKYSNIGLATTIQHTHLIKEIETKLTEKGLTVFTGRGVGKTPYDGQILGCAYKTVLDIREKVDAYLYIGGGRFHPIGIVMSTGKPVVTVNPYNEVISSITDDDLMNLAKRRYAAIALSKNAKNFCILVSSKPGQKNLEKGLQLQRMFRGYGKKAVIIYLDEIRAEHINNYSEFEVLVNTACPRIAIDGITGIERPILTINEAEVVLGVRKWETLWGNEYME